MSLATDSVVKYSTQTNIQHPVTALWKAHISMLT